MKKILQCLMTGIANVIMTFLLMAAPIAAIVFSSHLVDAAALPAIKTAIAAPYRELIGGSSKWFDAGLNHWYAELSGQPTTIDIVYKQLGKRDR